MINKISYLVIKVLLFSWSFLSGNRSTKSNRKRLNHNKFHNKRRPFEHLKLAILPKKLTQIYHKYLKTPHFAALFFLFFINNDCLSCEQGKSNQERTYEN